MLNPKSPTHVDKAVGQRLRSARREAGLTQTGLGELVGRTFQQVQKYEKGVNRISAGALFEFSAILKKDVSWFFEDERPSSGSGDRAARLSKDHPVFEDCLRLLLLHHESGRLGETHAILSALGGADGKRGIAA